ncbi:dimethylarginine dimethylaminohydrolase family protein [Halalkalibacter akibai]|uniref:NG,NG-dimethylarginine dimethylaminohydrolase 1 n=1 Tax=Halalkalibacter akibai (strain ATCC 43226 / DSM 21942 / CIP 109018 / JCM 9157 / 1139) TaxID=1236973 RepID=W4QQZ7_HALA3|nr:dimethylarginine dimethylaminohydrolase family protein [Halalkalibacter akibai]GAE34352.1 NG,NG-dimethylarginine dimethylaminohydrolase 1 [Halalkalibacter akibai JCM 9157]
MSLFSKTPIKPFASSEYDVLKKVILCKPEYMTIRDVINETQKKFKDEGIHIELALAQHKKFVQTLKDHDVDVILLPALKMFPEQVFTRDIGFTAGHIMFVAEMANKLRQGEEEVLKGWLEQQDMSYFNLRGDMIEGGDVIVNGNCIYVGLSDRTNQQAIDHLQTILPHYEIVTIPFTEKYLHLDCVFNIISPTEALFFPGAFTQKEIDILASRFELIEVSEEEQFTLGTNVLSIGNKKIFSLPVNKDVNEKLRNRGYEIVEVDITEIIKSGGSFRCCTLPVLRDGDQQ